MGVAAKDDLGRRGEELAAGHLQRRGWVVLARNWRCSEGELDIVATDGADTVVFCEVKTRSGTGFGTPVEAVTRGKRRRIRRLAAIWLAAVGQQRWVQCRFDVIGVLLGRDGAASITHVERAF